MKLGERLRFLRKQNQLTLKDLSQLANLSVPYLSDMERGEVNPSIESLQKVAKAFDMTVRDLFSGVEELGESVSTIYPEGFELFLKDPEFTKEITDEWKEFLVGMRYRGKQPSSKKEWIELHLSLSRIFSPQEEKVNDPKKQVIKLVQNTVKKYSSTEVPSFDEICSSLGLDVREAPLPSRIDGMHKDRTIFINSEIQNEERKRFTRFHELTHYLIEEDGDLIAELHDATFSQEGEYIRQLEKFCNIGAAEFLMPSEEFRKLYKAQGFNIRLIFSAARRFKISTIATTIQLAQIAPNSCITAICERGFVPNETVSRAYLFEEENISIKRKLHVVYSAPSPTTKYWLAKYTEIPEDHLISQAFSQTQPVEAESYVPFRSGKKMPCHCEALADGDKVYALFHLTPPPNPDQLTLI